MPTRSLGWVGRILPAPYPHAGLQQHMRSAADGKNMHIRIEAPIASVKPA